MRNIFKRKPKDKDGLVSEAFALYSLFSLLTNKFVLLAGAGLGFMIFSGNPNEDKVAKAKNIFCISSEFAKDATKSVKKCFFAEGDKDVTNIDSSKMSCFLSDAKAVYDKSYNDTCNKGSELKAPDSNNSDVQKPSETGKVADKISK
jgi:hypothetical protein